MPEVLEGIGGGILQDDIIKDENGWYFPMGDCRIGPYRDKGECRGDYERYLKYGRVSEDKGVGGVIRCPECEGI